MSPIINPQWNEILGMNARMLEYIQKSNPPEATRLANNKLATKKVLQKKGLATPRLFGLIKTRTELQRFRWTKLPSSFVLKPNAASGGGGIIVIFGRNKKGNWVKANRDEIFIPELRNHVLDILDGNFSKSNIPDVAFFEQRVKVHSDLKRYSIKGVPDIRILTYNLVPVMAMLRLPTEESGGRANLHSGGLGLGIDLTSGVTTSAVQYGKPIDTLPGHRISLSGIQIPYWDEILSLAVNSSEATGLYYAGIDVAIDRDDGPMVLEINARPGLDIQYANMSPLKSRLKRVEGLKVASPAKGVSLAKSLFGNDLNQEIEDMSGRIILGIEEKVSLITGEEEPYSVLSKVDTGAYRTTIDEALAQKLNLHDQVVEYKGVKGALGKQTRPIVDLTMQIRDRVINTQAFIVDRSDMKYDMIIGRRDLTGFLVDPNKRKKN